MSDREIAITLLFLSYILLTGAYGAFKAVKEIQEGKDEKHK